MHSDNERPREKRSSVIVRAAVYVCGAANPFERRVRNLSRFGACLEQTGELEPGAIIMLCVGGLTGLKAKVVWVTDRLAGITFEDAVDLDIAVKPRGSAGAPQAGWMAEINDAYRNFAR